jgi:hypothetical protein
VESPGPPYRLALTESGAPRHAADVIFPYGIAAQAFELMMKEQRFAASIGTNPIGSRFMSLNEGHQALLEFLFRVGPGGVPSATSVEKKSSKRLSREPCVGIKVKTKRPAG